MVKDRSYLSTEDAPETIEKGMKRISLWVSLLSMALMISGFILLLLAKNKYLLPGVAAFPIHVFFHLPFRSFDLALMSIGIILLGLLPAARLVLALSVYLFARDVKNVLVGLLVFLELLLSFGLGVG